MKKIKLFVDCHCFDHLYESTGVFLEGLYRELLDDERFEIFMAASNVDRLQKVFDHSDKIKYLTYKSESKYYRLAVDIPWLIRKHKIDVSHFQYVSPLLKNSLEIVTIHDLLFREFTDMFPWHYRLAKDFLFKRSAKRADLITTVSQFSHDAIARFFRISQDKIRIVPNGISAKLFTYNPALSRQQVRTKYGLEQYILYVSRVEPRKNHLSLTKAYVQNKLWERGIKLVFVGRTDISVKELNSYLYSLPPIATQNIVWLKNLTFNELLDLYKNALLFVYPSLAEGFGIPPLEAAALKVKTLCSNSTAMSDYAFFGRGLFNPGDISELSEKMLQYLEQNDSRRREHIAELVQERYNWKHIASGFGAIIYDMVKGSGKLTQAHSKRRDYFSRDA
jgi:glycosyltransferase involved in cell wall biosynthesis